MVTEVLMAIRPRYAEAILAGSKQYEVRRNRPGFSCGSRIWIYSTKPIGAVVGHFLAGEVILDSPAAIWLKFHDRLAISQEDLDQYLAGSSTATAIEVLDPFRLGECVRLETAAAIPQAYRYLRDTGADRELKKRLVTSLGKP